MKYIAKDKTYRLCIGEDRDDVIIGNEVCLDHLEADIKFTRWEKECSLSVAYENFNGVSIFDDNKLTLSEAKERVRLYQINNEKFEFEVILKKKPTTNKLFFKITSENLKFRYQPKLRQEDYDRLGLTVINERGLGSYNVYHKTKRNNKYKAGKAFIIYRPQAIDAGGNKVWCSYNSDLEKTGILSITIPQEFLDSAKYPAIIDPTFGNTDEYTLGGDLERQIYALRSTMGAADGTATKISAYIVVTGEAQDVKCAIYHNDESLKGKTELKAVPVQSYGWADFSITDGGSLLANIDYFLAAWGRKSYLGYTNIGLDMGHEADDCRLYDIHENPDGTPWPDPWDVYTPLAYWGSIYCTYDVGGNPYPIDWLKKKVVSGYHCFMNQYMKAKVLSYDPLKLPDGTIW